MLVVEGNGKPNQRTTIGRYSLDSLTHLVLVRPSYSGSLSVNLGCWKTLFGEDASRLLQKMNKEDKLQKLQQGQ
jgi:hypothetical protein